MDIKEFYNNKEVGRLIQFAYDLHSADFKCFPHLPEYEFYEGSRLYYGKEYRDGGLYGNIDFDNHSSVDALITLVVMSELDNTNNNPKKAMLLQTETGDYKPCFYELHQNKKDDLLKSNPAFYEMTDEEKINSFIDCLVFLGFQRDDIIKVINKEMTAQEAYQRVAPEPYKNRQWICYYRKIYEFDGNVATGGDYGCIHVDNFPFPFVEQPILDCSKVKTSYIYFDRNVRKVKLINVNSNPESINYTDIREAIIDEEIDASKVIITGTKFGEQKIINLEQSRNSYDVTDIALAMTGDEDFPKNRIRILSTATTPNSIVEGLSNGSSGIGLFRDELIIQNNSEMLDCLSSVKDIIYYVIDYIIEKNPIWNKLFDDIYHNSTKMYSLVEDKNIIFRLINLSFLDSRYRRVYFILSAKSLLCNEAKAIIKAAKKYNKTAKILVPYVQSASEFKAVKYTILEIAQEEEYDDIEFGAMIETKEAVVEVDDIAKEADFIVIGTNDLTESVMNKKRNLQDSDFSILADEVKTTISKIVHRVKKTKNIPINICGEHANYVENLEFLLSLNIDTITIHPNLVRGYTDLLNEYYEFFDQDFQEQKDMLLNQKEKTI